MGHSSKKRNFVKEWRGVKGGRTKKSRTVSTAPDLAQELHKLDATLRALNSPHRRFTLGMIHGVGTAIGATVIAAALIYAIISTLHALGLDGILEVLRLG